MGMNESLAALLSLVAGAVMSVTVSCVWTVLHRTTENFYTSSLLCSRIASQAAQAGQSQYAAPFA